MRRTISAANRPEDLQNPHGEQASKRGSAKDREKSCGLAPSRPGGGKDRADLSIRFRLLGREGRGGETKLLGCARRRGRREKERCAVKMGKVGSEKLKREDSTLEAGKWDCEGAGGFRVLSQWKPALYSSRQAIMPM